MKLKYLATLLCSCLSFPCASSSNFAHQYPIDIHHKRANIIESMWLESILFLNAEAIINLDQKIKTFNPIRNLNLKKEHPTLVVRARVKVKVQNLRDRETKRSVYCRDLM